MNSFPKLVLVATASPCNAKCVHCPCTVKPEIRKTEDAFIRPEFYRLIADECASNNAHLRMSGYGEPLLHPDIYNMIEYAKNIGCRVSLITNGSLFTEESIDRLMRMNIDSIEISADSHDRDIYRAIRVGLDYDKVMENIQKLVIAKHFYEAKTSIMVSIINQPSKNTRINESIDFWTPEVDKVLLRKYVTWGILPTDDCERVKGERTACPYPFERMMVDPAGYIRLCPYDDQKLIESFGRIGDTTIEAAWNSDRMTAIKSGHASKDFSNIELCNKCTDYAYRSWDYNYRSALESCNK